MTRHEFRILGALEVTSDAGDVDLGAPRQRALLALLALNGNRVVPRDRIIDALWGDAPPRTARNSLQVAVHGLRKALGADRVERRGTGYRLALRAGGHARDEEREGEGPDSEHCNAVLRRATVSDVRARRFRR